MLKSLNFGCRVSVGICILVYGGDLGILIFFLNPFDNNNRLIVSKQNGNLVKFSLRRMCPIAPLNLWCNWFVWTCSLLTGKNRGRPFRAFAWSSSSPLICNQKNKLGININNGEKFFSSGRTLTIFLETRL